MGSQLAATADPSVGTRPVEASSSAPAFDEFDAVWRPRVAGFVRRRLADRDAVDDVVQETLLRAYRKGLHHETGEDAGRWLITVARNLTIDASRRATVDPVDAMAVGRASIAPDAEADLLSTRRVSALSDALACLSDRQRHLVVGHHLEGRPYRELAHRERMSVEAVRAALARGRHALREHYAALLEHRGLAVLTPATAPLSRFAGRIRARLVPPPVQRAMTEWSGASPAVAQVASALALSAVAAASLLAPYVGAVPAPRTASAARAREVVPERPPPVLDDVAIEGQVGSRSGGRVAAEVSAGPAPGASIEEPHPDRFEDLPHAAVAEGPVAVSLVERDEVETADGTRGYAVGARADVDTDGDGTGDVPIAASMNVACPPPERRDAFWSANCMAAEEGHSATDAVGVPGP